MAANGELKKADKDLLNAIESGMSLKHADTSEKNPLPSKEVISQEKTIQGIESFDKNQLKHGETCEKTEGWKEAVSQEKTLKNIESFNKDQLKHVNTQEKTGYNEALVHEKTAQVVTQFDKTNLKHTDTKEKNPLPDSADWTSLQFGKQERVNAIKENISLVITIEEERKEVAHRKSIDGFDKTKLKRRNTEEKITLPSKEAIDQEKKEVEFRNSIGSFDKKSMNKVDTQERTGSAEMIAQEQTHKDIENFKRDSLKHTETQEKNTLPSKSDIEAEKKK